jgi:hypothetical protein
MDYTSTTQLARDGKKAFASGYKVVLCNNEDIGMILGKDYYLALMKSGILQQIREEMRESHDTTTTDMIDAYNNGVTSAPDSVSFDDFLAKQ